MKQDEPPALEAAALSLRLMLRFSQPAFERRFGRHYLAFYHRYAQAALGLGLLLVIGDFAVDWLARPALAANWLRLQLAVPILLLGLGYTLLPQARRLWQPVLAGFIVAVSLCLFQVLVRIDAEGGQGLTSWVGILNFTFLEFYCFIVLGVQFRVALIAGLAILGLFEATLWMHGAALTLNAAYWSYHVVTLFVLAAGLGWWREFILRKDFAAQCALEDARAAAEQLARAKSSFLATMSHEIRTPLNGVLGMNELLIGSPLNAEQRGWAAGVQASGRHLLALIDDVLDVSKIEAGRLLLEEVDFELGQVLDEARLMFAQPAAAKGLALRLEPVPPTWLRGDPLRLRQIVANLIGNAIKFTERGGITVSAGQEADEEPSWLRLRLVVEDSGIGIAEDARALIFDRFAQADSSTTRRYGGTGLGLAICRELATLMGGDIAVDSRPGEGSRFVVTLRLPRGTAAVTAARPAATPPHRLRGTVLLVEDHPVNRSVAIGMLRKLGLAWELAEDGADAVERVRRGHPAFDAVLMDCQMPVMDGFEATAAIRALPEGRGATLPIVALTANAGEEDQRQCREAGMDGFVAKPFTLAELAAALAPWLDAVADDAPPASAPAASVSAAERVIDRKAVAMLLELDEAGDLLREVFAGFLAGADEGLARIGAAIAANEAAALGRAAHSLKSSASNVGARRLSEVYAELERCARRGTVDAAAAQLALLRDEQARAVAELRALLREHA